MPQQSSNAQRLAEAGIISTEVTGTDLAVIDQLSEQEVTILIGVATRLYSANPAAVKVQDLMSGQFRIMFPL